MDWHRIRLFETPAADADLLVRWRDAPLTYRRGQALPGAHVDHYEERLVSSADQAAFHRAADLLLRYRFYPDDVMAHTSDFEREGRRMRTGDRMVAALSPYSPSIMPGFAKNGGSSVYMRRARRLQYTAALAESCLSNPSDAMSLICSSSPRS